MYDERPEAFRVALHRQIGAFLVAQVRAPARAAEHLARLKRDHPQDVGTVRGKEVVLADALAAELKTPVETTAGAAGDSYPMFGGDPSRGRVSSAKVSPGAPLLDTYLQGIELLRDLSHVRDYSRPEWEAALVRAGLTPTSVAPHRVRLDFAVWIERMKTPKLQADAIRAIQAAMSEPVVRHYDIGADGSFTLDVVLFQATKEG